MDTCRRIPFLAIACTAVFAALLFVQPAAGSEAEPKPEKMPDQVTNTLNAKFPGAEIDKWSKEKEGDIIVFDVEFKVKGQKLEADILEDGTIHNWEKAIEAKDLPKPVAEAVAKKYSGWSMQEIMQVTAVEEGKDKLEGFEIVLAAADKKSIEVTVAPDGKFLEEPGDEE